MYKLKISSNLEVLTDDQKIIADLEVECTFHWVETKHDGEGIVEVPHISKLYRHIEGGIAIPIGYVHFLIAHYGQPSELVQDTHTTPAQTKFRFEGDLRPNQMEAFEQLAKLRYASVRADTGSGKTVLAVALTREHEMKTLFIVPTKRLMNQTIEKYRKFLPDATVGRLGDGFVELDNDVVVGIIDSVYNHLDEVYEAKFGVIFVDEAHRIAHNRYLEVLKKLKPHFRFALTATPYRFDGFERFMEYFVGHIYCDITHDDPPTVFFGKIETTTKVEGYDLAREFKAWETELYNTPSRYTEMLDVLSRQTSFGHICMVVVGRVQTAKMLVEMINKSAMKAVEYTSATASDEVIEDFVAKKFNVLVATQQMVSEGVDIPELNDLFNTVVFKDKKQAAQLIGRLRRGTGYKWFYDMIDPMQYTKNAFYTRSSNYSGGGRLVSIPTTVSPRDITE